MKSRIWQNALLILLAIVFAVGLTYATVELPHVLSSALIESLGDAAGPDFDYETGLSQHFIDSYHVRVIGACCLILVAALIVIGLFLERSGLSSLGAVALFLPVFGHFALSMSMLAGLGVLRVIWMPIIEAAPSLLRLGDVALVPYMVAVYLPALAGIDIRVPLIFGLMALGIALFTLGVLVWLQSRFKGQDLALNFIYRFSRHPQYLGWIIWSYGLMIHVSRLPGPRIMWSVESSLPWLIATVAIVCVALLEEIRLRRDLGPEYENYKAHAPFLLPVPRIISRIVSAPMRLVLAKDWPECGKDVAVVFAVYIGILTALSIPFGLFDWPHRAQAMWQSFPYNVPPFR
jgi:protein-S-isoprenylcysteine O-methyltransferase Ste14